MNSVFLAMLIPLHGVQAILPTLEVTQGSILPYVVQVDNPRESKEPSDTSPPTKITGSTKSTNEIQYGEIFNKESEKLPFYLQPEFGGLDGSDHRREVLPNAAGQRLDMDQYNRLVRPPVGQ